ncbi:uncharacterized protein LOC110860359 [Folsomia candida]|uniref:uncharacterized protein LOC110860359 n=1 Tax=Folsomia candida TaxID=158441 RepID=UPI000B8F8C88|nr:uncharacterized protein LOC110860359 [Folsomia candida]
MEEETGGGLNPLLVPLIAQQVFLYLGPRDVAKCRAVCSTWCSIATPMFICSLDEIQVRFRGNTEHGPKELETIGSTDLSQIFSHGQGTGEEPKLSPFSKYCDSTKSIKYTNFSMENIDLTDHDAHEFFLRFGQDIKILRLHIEPLKIPRTADNSSSVISSRYVDNETFKSILLARCPNLVKLDISNLPLRATYGDVLEPGAEIANHPKTNLQHLSLNCLICTPGFIRYLCLISPNLHTVEFLEGHNRHLNHPWLDYIETLSTSRRLPGITSLSINHLNDGRISKFLLYKDQIHLKKLVVQRFNPVNVELEFFQLLETQSGTLQYFEIFFHSDGDNGVGISPIIFPRMENLTDLVIGLEQGSSLELPGFNIVNMSIAPKFPSLRRCILHGYKLVEHISALFGPMSKPLLTLRELQLPPGLDKDMMRKVANLFPNVETLAVGCQSDASFQNVFKMSKLKSLFMCVQPGYVNRTKYSLEFRGLDALLTGCSSEEIAETAGDDKVSMNPAITDLQDLRTLVIHGRHRLGVGMGSDCEVHDKISDNSIRVLHKLGRLSSIHIFDCKVTSEEVSYLATRLDLNNNSNVAGLEVHLGEEIDDKYTPCPMCKVHGISI